LRKTELSYHRRLPTEAPRAKERTNCTDWIKDVNENALIKKRSYRKTIRYSDRESGRNKNEKLL